MEILRDTKFVKFTISSCANLQKEANGLRKYVLDDQKIYCENLFRLAFLELQVL